MKSQQNTAILFFSRSVRAESLAKKYMLDESVNFSIAKHLIIKAKKQLQQAPYPVYQIDECNQYGSNFGEKLTNAFKEIFSKGYNYVIAVGNDCLDLQFDYHQISDSVKYKKAIIGPDYRGGVFMLGISKDIGYAAIFNKISWKEEGVFSQLSEALEHCVIIDKKRDINTHEDIANNQELLNITKGLIVQKVQILLIIIYTSILQFTSILLRGPPAIIYNH